MSDLKKPLDAPTLITQSMKIPGVKIEREDFLYQQLKNRYPHSVVRKAIEQNPAAAGISRGEIDELAKKTIKYETSKVSAISFAAGIPGGFAMLGTVPADIAQYFGFILRILQKLAYLYGFDDFQLRADAIDDDTMNELLVFLGVMFGVNEASAAIKVLAENAARAVAKHLAEKALTKGAVYPFVKVIAKQLGVAMTKQVFAKGVSKTVPLIGGFTSGGITYASFRICSNRLKDKFAELPISDPNYYSHVDTTD